MKPDKRYGKVFDVLIEFKFVKLKDAGMSTDQARQLSENELCMIPEIAKQIKDGEKQVQEYGNKLEKKYGNLRLQKFVVAGGLKEYVLERFKTGQWGRMLNINYSFSIIKN